jgi:hypothetical protein
MTGVKAGAHHCVTSADAGLQQPHPGGQLRRHIQHPLTRGGQLPGQQAPSPAAPSTAQARCGHPAAQASSCPAWDRQVRTRSPPSSSSAAPIATAVGEPLRGVNPDRHVHHQRTP